MMFRGFISIFLFISCGINKAGSENPINKNPRSFVCIIWIRLWTKDSDYDSFMSKTKFFKQLYWIDDVQFSIYWLTCVERSFAKDNEYWYHCFDDNIIHVTAHQLRLRFVIGMLTNEIGDLRVIWIKYNEHFFDNFFRRIEQKELQFSQFLTNFYHNYCVNFFIMFWKNKIKFCKTVICLIWCSIEPRNTIKLKKNHNSQMMLRSQRTCEQNWISINYKYLFESSRLSTWIWQPLISIYKDRKKRKKSFCIKLFVIIIMRKKNEFCASHSSK